MFPLSRRQDSRHSGRLLGWPWGNSSSLDTTLTLLLVRQKVLGLSGQHTEAMTAGFALSSCQLFANHHLMPIRVKVSVWDFSVSCHTVLSPACTLTRLKLSWRSLLTAIEMSWAGHFGMSAACHAESAVMDMLKCPSGKSTGVYMIKNNNGKITFSCFNILNKMKPLFCVLPVVKTNLRPLKSLRYNCFFVIKTYNQRQGRQQRQLHVTQL